MAVDTVASPSAGLDQTGSAPVAPSPSAHAADVSPAAGIPPAVVPPEGALSTSQELGQPGAGPEQPRDDANIPWARDPRFQEDMAALKAYKAQKPVIDQILERISTPEDAQTLIESVQQFQQETERRTADPVGYFAEFATQNPEAWTQVARASYTETLRNLWSRFQAAGDENSSNAVAVLWAQLNGEGASGPEASGSRQLQQERARVRQEGERTHKQQSDFFNQRVTTEVERSVLEKVNPFIEKVPFVDEEQRGLFLKTLYEKLDEALGKNQAFVLRQQGILRAAKAAGYSDEHVKQIVQSHLSQATANGFLEHTARKLLRTFGQQIVEQHRQQLSQEQQAQQRREPAGGAPAPGGRTEAQKDARLRELVQQLGPQKGMTKYLEEQIST